MCTAQPSASYDWTFLSFLQHYNYVLQFTVTINISGFSHTLTIEKDN